MSATKFCKGAAATENHLLWNQPTSWLLRWNQVRSPDSGQELGWINPAHLATGAKSHYSTYMYCSMTKLEGHSREICYTSAGSHASLQQNQFGRPPANLWSFPSRLKKMGQEIRPKKTILARPSESDIGGWLCSHQCGNEEKKLGQSAPDDDMPRWTRNIWPHFAPKLARSSFHLSPTLALRWNSPCTSSWLTLVSS